MKLLICGDPWLYPKVEDLEIANIYRPLSKIGRFIRYVHHKSGLLPQLKKFWLGSWRKNIKRYKNIIIFDTIYDYTPLIEIRNQCENTTVHFVFRNRVHGNITHQIVKRDPEDIKNIFGCTVWSYSDDDCQKFNLKKYNQFHLIPEKYNFPSNEIQYDSYFVGIDKGRLKSLKDIAHILNKINYSCKLEIVPSPNTEYSNEDKTLFINSVPYEEVLNRCSKSKCIIDWVSEANKGMTYRSLEAAVLKKKLITNYQDIVKAPFYDARNIFVWGIDDLNFLPQFLNTPYYPLSFDVFERYSFKEFCKLIFNS